MQIKDSVILITGASAGIGRDLAMSLGPRGARLVLAARSEDKLQQISAELSQQNVDVLVVKADVCDPTDLQVVVDRATEHFGRIDVLINNAGVECYRYFETAEAEDILQTIETNLTGAILLTRLVIPHMLKTGSGCIVNMASTAGKHCPPHGAVYGATKAALIGFTQGLRGEYLRRGISATAICPGFTRHGGIYDRMVQATGKTTNIALGGTSTRQVTRAVVKAIEKGPPELIVNWPPVRPAMVIREIIPRLGEILVTAASKSFTRRAARISAEPQSQRDVIASQTTDTVEEASRAKKAS